MNCSFMTDSVEDADKHIIEKEHGAMFYREFPDN